MLAAGALLGVLAAGLLAGIVSGLFGVGGGVLMVPATLYLVPRTDFHEAKAVSLVVIIASSAVGIWTHQRKGSVDLRMGALLALGGLAGAAVSVLGVEQVSDRALTALFAILLALTGARLAFGREREPREMRPRAKALYLVGIGALGGVLSGAFGVGGGIVVVPGMVLAGVGMHMAIGTSLVAVLGNAIGGTATHLALGYGPTLVTLGIPLAIGAVPGTIIGSRLAHKIRADRLRIAFGIGLMLAAAAMILSAVRS